MTNRYSLHNFNKFYYDSEYFTYLIENRDDDFIDSKYPPLSNIKTYDDLILCIDTYNYWGLENSINFSKYILDNINNISSIILVHKEKLLEYNKKFYVEFNSIQFNPIHIFIGNMFVISEFLNKSNNINIDNILYLNGLYYNYLLDNYNFNTEEKTKVLIIFMKKNLLINDNNYKIEELINLRLRRFLLKYKDTFTRVDLVNALIFNNAIAYSNILNSIKQNILLYESDYSYFELIFMTIFNDIEFNNFKNIKILGSEAHIKVILEHDNLNYLYNNRFFKPSFYDINMYFYVLRVLLYKIHTDNIIITNKIINNIYEFCNMFHNRIILSDIYSILIPTKKIEYFNIVSQLFENNSNFGPFKFYVKMQNLENYYFLRKNNLFSNMIQLDLSQFNLSLLSITNNACKSIIDKIIVNDIIDDNSIIYNYLSKKSTLIINYVMIRYENVLNMYTLINSIIEHNNTRFIKLIYLKYKKYFNNKTFEIIL